jgi:hypothetical protein
MFTNAGTGLPGRPIALALAIWLAAGATTAHAADDGKHACMPDAKRLCSNEMRSLSRRKVQACLIQHMEETTPVCHDFMVKARTEAMSGHAPGPASQ